MKLTENLIEKNAEKVADGVEKTEKAKSVLASAKDIKADNTVQVLKLDDKDLNKLDDVAADAKEPDKLDATEIKDSDDVTVENSSWCSAKTCQGGIGLPGGTWCMGGTLIGRR